MRKFELPPPRVSRVTIPVHAHPAARIVFAEMKRQFVTYDELAHRSGVLRQTVKAWRNQNSPGISSMQACLGALGWSYLPVPKLENLPPTVRAKLDEAAAEWGEINPLLMELMAGICRAYEPARLSYRDRRAQERVAA